ncbi:MAG: hypothetical protein BWX55_00239 [Deltaproteobacteria bacterium ADurb.Bin022]|nr:MAG: hypothetical protein BWX55_00239 [Deltaproteobacteria bacterium ADurb.Bin022]
MKIFPAFGMTDDDIPAADIFEHQRGHFPGKCTLVFIMHVLRRQFQTGAFDRLAHSGKRGKRRSQDDSSALNV